MKDTEIMDIDNTLENEVAETGSKVPEEKKKKNDIVEKKERYSRKDCQKSCRCRRRRRASYRGGCCGTR